MIYEDVHLVSYDIIYMIYIYMIAVRMILYSMILYIIVLYQSFVITYSTL
jgi:hypothetical protein